MLPKQAGAPSFGQKAKKMLKPTNEQAKNAKDDVQKISASQIKVSNRSHNSYYLTDTEAVTKGGILWDELDGGRVDNAAALVSEGADLTVRKAEDKRTVMHEVLRSFKIKDNAKREKLIKMMLDSGADINASDADGYSLLHDALAFDHCSTQLVVELLNRGAAVSISKVESENDIFWTAIRKPELLPRIIAHRVKHKATRIERGAMAVHYLILKADEVIGACETIRKLLDLGVSGSSTDPLAKKACTLLDTAFSYDRKDIIKLLLDYDANPHQKNEFGYTPLSQAITQEGYSDVIRLLIKKGASIHARNDDGYYPIHVAWGTNL